MLGTRGIPASYSGFETCVEELGSRLVERGHEVSVYCRTHHITYPEPFYKGMRLVKLPTLRNKYLDTIVHAFLSSLHALGQRYDVALYFIAGNSLVTWIPRLAGQKTVLNVDGLDWKREKWPPLAKRYIRLAEHLATKLPTCMITDSRVVQQYYRDRFGIDAPYIAYGADLPRRPPGPYMARYGLEKDRYILFVGRLVPENCAHHLLEAFERLNPPNLKCVIVGDAPYAEAYIASLRARESERVVFTGYLFGEGYQELLSNALIFVETSGVGGTHPALLEAMSVGNCVVVHNTPENLETLGDAGLSYDGTVGGESLAQILRELVASPEKVAAFRQAAAERVAAHYSWERVTDAYEALFHGLLKGRSP